MRYLIFSIYLLFSAVGYSQINKHEWLAGGYGSFQTVLSGPTPNTSSYTVAPDFGYFIINNLAFGSGLEYRHQKTVGSGNFEYVSHYFIVSPFVRYYVLPSSNKVNVFLHVGYQHYTSTASNPGSPSNTSQSHGYDFKAGPSIFLNPHVALEITIDYTKTVQGIYAFKEFSSGVGFQIHLGPIHHKTK